MRTGLAEHGLDQVFATFTRDAPAGRRGEAAPGRPLGRIEPPARRPRTCPTTCAAYPGVYLLARRRPGSRSATEDGALLLHDPLAKATRRLKPASKGGGWVDESAGSPIWFDAD